MAAGRLVTNETPPTCFLHRQLTRPGTNRYPDATPSAPIRRTMFPNSRLVEDGGKGCANTEAENRRVLTRKRLCERGAVREVLMQHRANPTGRSRLAFARDKGEAEKTLLAARFPRVYIFRPAYIYPVEPCKEPNLSYRLLRAIYPAFRVLFPNQMIPADELGRAMVDAAVLGTVESEARILENRDIRAMVKS